MDIKRRILAGFIVLGISQLVALPLSIVGMMHKGILFFYECEGILSFVMFSYGFLIGETM